MRAIVNLRNEPRLREEFEYAPVVNSTVLIDHRTKWGTLMSSVVTETGSRSSPATARICGAASGRARFRWKSSRSWTGAGWPAGASRCPVMEMCWQRRRHGHPKRWPSGRARNASPLVRVDRKVGRCPSGPGYPLISPLAGARSETAPIPIARCAPCALRLPPPSAGVSPPWRAAALSVSPKAGWAASHSRSAAAARNPLRGSSTALRPFGCGPPRSADLPGLSRRPPRSGGNAVFERKETDMTDLFSTDTAMADAFASAGIETALDAGTVETAADTGDDDREPEHAASATAVACDSLALHGATPGRDEFDSREVWDRDDASTAIAEAFRIMAQGVAPDGFQLADERESLLWGFVNMLDAQTKRLDRAADKLLPHLRDLQRAQDGTEIKSRELELVHRPRAEPHPPPRRLRDHARRSRRSLPRGHRQHMAAPARLAHQPDRQADFRRRRRPRLHARPQEPRDHGASSRGNLDRHRGRQETSPTPPPSSPGWTRPARNTPTWCSCMAADPASRRSRRDGPSATACTRSSASPIGTGTDAPHPSAATTTLLNLLPKGVIAFPGSGITDNLVDKARQLGIPVQRIAA